VQEKGDIFTVIEHLARKPYIVHSNLSHCREAPATGLGSGSLYGELRDRPAPD
jgi:hypothetical protein